MMKDTVNRLQLTVFLIAMTSVLFILYPVTYNLKPTFAQTPSCGSGTPARNEGLVTTPTVSGKTSSTGACITGDEVIFVPFKIPNFEDLKSRFYTQSRFNKVEITTTLPAIASQTLYHKSNDLSISSVSGSGTAIVFVDGSLTITGNITYGTAQTGLVFIVGGDVVIDKAVTAVNAVIIAQGKIHTAGAGCLPSTELASALTINGSLIALSESNQIRFCRRLSTNDKPSEVINHQSKYLVILRDMFSETLQKWEEIP